MWKKWYKNVVITESKKYLYLVCSPKVSLPMLEQIHKNLVEISGFLDFEYIDNRNIRGFLLYKDGSHLLEEGKEFLINSFYLI